MSARANRCGRHPSRQAHVERATRETQIAVSVDLDGSGRAELATGIPFLDHMLDQVARHGMIDLDGRRQGRPAHRRAITPSRTSASPSARRSSRRSATRPGCGATATPTCRSTRPCRASSSISRAGPGSSTTSSSRAPMIGAFDVDLTHEFFQGFVNHALVSAAHRQPARRQRAPPGETVFKAFARALRMAISRDPRAAACPSTKGTL